MPVITISRQYGSAGEAIAYAAARELGYDYVDKELLAEVAQLANASETDIEAFDERDERGLLSFLKKTFLGSVAYDYTMYYPFIWGADPPNFYRRPVQPAVPILTQKELVQCFNTVIDRLWQRGDIFLVGRGSQIVLKEKPNTIHIRFVAPLEVRCARIMQEQSLSHDAALARIREADKQRAQYLRRYYDANWSDPTLYHLVVNTGLCSKDSVVKFIIGFIRTIA